MSWRSPGSQSTLCPYSCIQRGLCAFPAGSGWDPLQLCGVNAIVSVAAELTREGRRRKRARFIMGWTLHCVSLLCAVPVNNRFGSLAVIVLLVPSGHPFLPCSYTQRSLPSSPSWLHSVVKKDLYHTDFFFLFYCLSSPNTLQNKKKQPRDIKSSLPILFLKGKNNKALCKISGCPPLLILELTLIKHIFM